MTPHPDNDSVAVVGMAARFPAGQDLDEFWATLRDGREAVRFPTDDELLDAGVPPRLLRDPSYVKAVAEAPGLEMFDADFFGFTPREATLLDPQIRMFLEVGHAAVEHAGYDPMAVAGGMGVFGATGVNRYLDLHVRAAGELSASSTAGLALSTLSYPDYVATQMAYRFGFRGPALTVSTACSSSALAIHLACQSLRLGECDIAIAGGTEAEMPAHHGYQWDPGGPMSADGHCRPFDEAASGTVFSTGAGAVVLKRLGEALADGDHVWAVIRASAVNNDGRTKAGFSAPGVPGQVAVIREAMALADVDATDLSYVEAHATGTLLGDPVEVAALTQAYASLGSQRRTDPLLLSSVKGNIGHLGHASGVASLVKLALCFEHEHRAPTANFTEPNSRLNLAESPFSVTRDLEAWPRRPDVPRIAGMSSLGIGGTNVHIVVEEGNAPARTPFDGRPRVLIWSGRDSASVDAYQPELAAHLKRTGDPGFADTAGILQDGRTHHPVRAALVARDADEAAKALAAGRVVRADAGVVRPIVFMFPGQAAQHPRMAAGLYGVDHSFSAAIDACFEQFASCGLDLRDPWLGADAEDLADTAIAQPLLFSIEYALAKMWGSWGVRPDAVLGHSLGEFTAAAVAGVFDLSDAVQLIAERSAASAAAPPGGMLAVRTSLDDLAGLSDLPDGVVVAVVNSESECVLAGAKDEIELTEKVVRAKGLSCRMLATSRAFHSPLMAAAAERFGEAVRAVGPREPDIPMFSAAAGGLLSGQVRDPEFWSGQLVRPVRFDRALRQALADEPCTLLEVGPAHTLTRLARTHPAVRSGGSNAIATLPPRQSGDDESSSYTAAATLWAGGHDLDWAAVRGNQPVRRYAVPGYQYQRKRHWLELSATEVAPEIEREAEKVAESVAGTEPFTTLTWVERHRAGASRPETGAVALALVPDSPAAMPALLALRQAGYRVVVARPGREYGQVAGEFRLRPDHMGDLNSVLAALSADNRTPRLLVHGLGVEPAERPTASTVDDQLAGTFHSFADLARAAARLDGAELLALTCRSADITGAEDIDPVKATMHGAVRTLALETPELAARLIDFAPLTAEEDLAAEITATDREPVVALRGPTRWVRTECQYRSAATSAPVVRRDGVYLLTGGSGGLGLAIAHTLAGTGMRPHLVLLSRTGVVEKNVVAALEAMGARVRVEACDVTDRRGMRRILDTIRAHHGALHGVVHMAGIAGDGVLLLRDRAKAAEVLRPKVMGTLVLEEMLEDLPPLDFFVSFSSRASIGGLIGSADYAAANSFLDAHTRLLARAGIPAISVNWPAWSTVGMAAEPEAGTHWRTVLDVDSSPVLDEHRVDSVPVLPGTGHLDLVVRAFRETLGGPAMPVRITDVVFQRVLTATAPRRVDIGFVRDGDGWKFMVTSTSRESDDARVEHATGFVSTRVPARSSGPALETLRDRLTRPVPVDGGADVRRLFALGPRWDNVRRIALHPDHDHERLVDLALPEPFHAELAQHPLHPALLDSATAEARVAGSDAPHLPFGYASLDLYEDLPATLVSHIQRRPSADGLIVADVDLYAQDGRLLVSIKGFTMRKVDGKGFLAAPEDVAPPQGIAPEHGGELFLALLGSRQPHQVAVRPYVDGKPDPLPAPRTVTAPLTLPSPQVVSKPSAPVPMEQPERTTDPVERLAQLWSRTLGIEKIRPDDNFFELGGNSLTAVDLMSAIRDEFGTRLNIVTMFDHPTLTELAGALAAEGGAET